MTALMEPENVREQHLSQTDNGHCCPAINRRGTEPHTAKDTTTIAGALAFMQPYHSLKMVGRNFPHCRALGLVQTAL